MSQTYASPALAQFLYGSTANSQSLPPRTTQAQQESQPQTFGYYHTFHSRAQPDLDSPPTYEKSKCIKPRAPPPRTEPLPGYSASIHMEGVLGLKEELVTPFTKSKHQNWLDVYAVLSGTCLSLYRVKKPPVYSKDRTSRPGRLLKRYTMQHAEVGVAMDWRKTDPVPKHYLSHLIPLGARSKVYESDPHLFEPMREHVLRLRPECEQILLCASSAKNMLHWVEAICSSMDISQPLEDRAEPRYRSLPRRTRRQRLLEAQLSGNLEQLNEDSTGRRFIEEQCRLLERMYPNLGAQDSSDSSSGDLAALRPTQSNDLDAEDFDPADIREEPIAPIPIADDFSARRNSLPANRTSRLSASTGSQTNHFGADVSQTIPTIEEEPQPRLSISSNTSGASSPRSSDSKPQPRPAPTSGHILRYRKRCAPILLSTSPRNSDVVFKDGVRMRIIPEAGTLVPFEQHPPRYESHKFPLSVKLIPEPPSTSTSEFIVEAAEGQPTSTQSRPSHLSRGMSSYSTSRDSIVSSSMTSAPTTPTVERDLDLTISASPLEQTNTHDTIPSKDDAHPKTADGKGRKMRLFNSMRLKLADRSMSDSNVTASYGYAWGG